MLLLDNFEQLLTRPDEGIKGGEELLTSILEAAPSVKLLVTSREVLNLQEEWLYQVQGLPFPKTPLLGGEGLEEMSYDAVQLFVERARRVRRDFSLADEQANVVRICQLVEGAPNLPEAQSHYLQVKLRRSLSGLMAVPEPSSFSRSTTTNHS